MQPEADLRDHVTAPDPIEREHPKFRSKDIPVAFAILLLALIVQLIEAQALTVEQGQRVFQGALQNARKSKDRPDVSRLILHIHETMPWKKLYAAVAQRRRPKS
jgi:hypothetical protein